jgi:4-deoxy-L-threo-5-hexosulose-uronate ketol-isomerase
MAQEHITFSSRPAIDPGAAALMDTEELRDGFHLGDLFEPGRISLTYTYYDRMIVGGAVPLGEPLVMEAIQPTGTKSFLERRELVTVNVGGAGSVTTGSGTFALAKRDMVYAGMGETVTFASDDPGDPARFYLLSAPAHHAHPTQLIRIDDARRIDLGSPATSNERSIFQFIHPEGVKTCQLVAGMTCIAPGSVWNTMPPHVHDRRMEVYLYFDLEESARAFHFLGEPDETRHILVKNEEAVLSPPWSIHAGVGTSSYWFIWGMAGDNVDYTDVDPVPLEALL